VRRKRRRARVRTRVWLGDEREEGDDTVVPPVNGSGRGRVGCGLAALLGRLGRSAELGCFGASEPEQTNGGALADFGLLGREQK
jgi:hypothetical protein